MFTSNDTSMHDLPVLFMNTNLSRYGSASDNGLTAVWQEFVKSLQMFPTWITNTLFNIIYAFGILANILLLVYIIYYKRYKMPVFCVILSLGVADLGVCVGCLTYYTRISPYILGPLWLCNIAIGLSFVSYLASSYHIAVFAVLRFIQLVYPLTSHSKVTAGLLLKVCLAIWVIQAIQAFILAANYEAVNIAREDTSGLYVCAFMGNQYARIIWTIIAWYTAPFILTTSIHLAKQVTVVLSRSVTMTSHDHRAQKLRRETDSRALAFVIIAYLVAIFPIIVQCFRVHVFFVTYHPIESYLVEIFGQIAFAHSAINPWIYLFAAESVRSDIRKMLTCKR